MLSRASIRSYDPYQHVQQRFSCLQYSKQYRVQVHLQTTPQRLPARPIFKFFCCTRCFFFVNPVNALIRFAALRAQSE